MRKALVILFMGLVVCMNLIGCGTEEEEVDHISETVEEVEVEEIIVEEIEVEEIEIEEIEIEEIDYPDEYLEALEYNSKKNVYFGIESNTQE